MQSKDLHRLALIVSSGMADLDTYRTLMAAADGKIKTEGLFNLTFLITFNGNQHRIASFASLRPWFMENVLPFLGCDVTALATGRSTAFGISAAAISEDTSSSMSIIGIIALGFFVGVCYLIGQGTNTYALLATIAFVPASIALYFAPTIVASLRKHPNRTSLFVLNLFLGWTLIGWVGALVWAYSAKPQVTANVVPTTQDPTSLMEPAADTKKCPFCAELVRLEAIKCKHCGSDISSK